MNDDWFRDVFAALSVTIGRIIDHLVAAVRDAINRAWPVGPLAPSHDETAADPYRSPGEPAAVPPERTDGPGPNTAYLELVRLLRELTKEVREDIGASGVGRKQIGPPVMPTPQAMRDDGFSEWFDHASKNDHVDAVPWALEQRDAEGNVILRADIVRREPVSRPRPPIAPPKPVSE